LSGKLNSGTLEKSLDVSHEFERWLGNNLWRCKRKFLIDTGSPISLIRKDILKSTIQLQKPSLVVQSVNGDILDILGMIQHEVKGKINWYVVKTLPDQLGGILGRDFLKSNPLIIPPLSESLIEISVNKQDGNYFLPYKKVGPVLVGQGIIEVKDNKNYCLVINQTPGNYEITEHLRIEEWEQLKLK
jgi:Retroviral aspartyl protease.